LLLLATLFGFCKSHYQAAIKNINAERYETLHKTTRSEQKVSIWEREIKDMTLMESIHVFIPLSFNLYSGMTIPFHCLLFVVSARQRQEV
jgi:hypothetical protein